ncbi:MAG TPA: hypothetical protein VES42_18875 [Pilimelia sp.]|nr:hypothetical protein [Pilimelia sp.]
MLTTTGTRQRAGDSPAGRRPATRRWGTGLLAAALLALAMVTVPASPASAAPVGLRATSVSCRVTANFGGCTAGSIFPTNVLLVTVVGSAGCDYLVRDVFNNKVVFRDEINIYPVENHTLLGLWAGYRLELSSCIKGSSGELYSP